MVTAASDAESFARAMLDSLPGQASRRLFTIVHVDMVGYSRLIGQDLPGTVERLRAVRREVMTPLAQLHEGELVQTAGDSFVFTFSNMMQAARFALTLQRQVARRGEQTEAAQRIRFRVGIELGDVIADGTDLHGNGLNVAARLQTACPPGGLCVSGTVHEQIRHDLDVIFEPAGSLVLKNIAQPVEAFIARLDPAEDVRAPADGWQVFPDAARYRNSVAVMRFASLGGAADETYFADGVVEDVVTALSRFRTLFVIGPSTSFNYATGKDSVRDVVRELGVRYVVDGSVRRVGSKVRTHARLVDSSTGGQLWAQRFDFDEADVFTIQDRITERIVTAIEPTVVAAEIARATRKTTGNLDAYDLFLRAMSFRGLLTRESLIEHHRLLSEAVALDPSYAPALAYAASCYSVNIDQALNVPWLTDRAAGIRLADAALAAGPDDPLVLCRAGHARAALTDDVVAAVGHMDRALELNPNYAEAWIRSSVFRVWLDQLETAIEHANRGIALSPRDRYMWLAYVSRGTAQLFLGQYEAAVVSARHALGEQQRPIWAYWILIPALMELGLRDEALAVTEAFRKRAPDFTVSKWRTRITFYHNRRFDLVEKWLKAVGVPA